MEGWIRIKAMISDAIAINAIRVPTAECLAALETVPEEEPPDH